MNKEQRHLLVVSGPSGIGKDTVVNNLIKNHEGIELAVSATTRPPRPGETQGRAYYYMDVPHFQEMIDQGEFVEYTNYAGNFYGTLKEEVNKRIRQGITCVLVIEVNGTANVRRVFPDCTTVFIVAPTMEEHERRLRARGSESEEVMAERMRIAQEEMKMADSYNYVLMNDDAERCAEELYQLLKKRQEDE